MCHRALPYADIYRPFRSIKKSHSKALKGRYMYAMGVAHRK